MVWVMWDIVCSPIEKRGFGIKHLEVLNRALLGKWMWRFVSDK